MKKILNIGVIGAGAISDRHLASYADSGFAKIISVSDLNKELAKEKAEKYGAEKYTTDYKEILADESIDAVSIVTPTFTHCQIIVEALEAGKHVLCEKPPALNASEVEKCQQAAEKSGKVLMFGFVCRFKKEAKYLKELIDNGKMGKIYYAEAHRIGRCSRPTGWFGDKSKSGGCMLDGCIHEIDACLYLMGYPKPVSVLGYTNDINKDLPDKIKGMPMPYQSSDKKKYDCTVESMASGFVTFENGASMHIKASYIMNSVKTGAWVDISAEKMGARYQQFNTELETLEISDEGYFVQTKPVLRQEENLFASEINHFIDCVLSGTECIVKPEQAVTLMKIIDAIYLSAETNKPVVF